MIDFNKIASTGNYAADYVAPDWMKQNFGMGIGAYGTDHVNDFFNSNPQYAQDFMNIANGGKSSFSTDGSSLIKTDLNSLPSGVADYYRQNPSELLAAEGFGYDPTLQYMNYNQGPGSIGVDIKRQNPAEFMSKNRWTPNGIVAGSTQQYNNSRAWGAGTQSLNQPGGVQYGSTRPTTTNSAQATPYQGSSTGGGAMTSTYQQNPYAGQMAGTLAQQMAEQFQRQIQPQIAQSAIATGGYGGSRQGVLEANAANDLQQNTGQAVGTLLGNRYGQDLSYNLGMGNLGLGYANLDRSIANDNNQWGLQGAQLGMQLQDRQLQQNQLGLSNGSQINNNAFNNLIAEMIAKRGTPDMQVTNGYAYDKNRLNAGYLPQLNISNDGKATQVRIGPDGQPVVSAPQGAPETFGTYQGIQAGIQSANTPIKVFNPQTQREEFIPQSTALRGASAQPQYSGAGYAGGSAAAAAPEQLQIMQSELNKLPPNHPDRPAIMREMLRLGGGQVAQSGNYAAGPSAMETAANEAAKAQAIGQVKADIQPTDQRNNGLAAARDMLSVIDTLQKHPGRETATGLSGVFDPRNYVPGTDAKDFRVALDQLQGKTFLQAFESLKGGGQVTEVEGKKATDAIARLNTAQSDKAFNQALGDLRQIVVNSLERQQSSAQRSGTGGATGSFDAPKPQQKEFSMLPNANEYANRRLQGPDGSIYRSTGGKWVKE